MKRGEKCLFVWKFVRHFHPSLQFEGKGKIPPRIDSILSYNYGLKKFYGTGPDFMFQLKLFSWHYGFPETIVQLKNSINKVCCKCFNISKLPVVKLTTQDL